MKIVLGLGNYGEEYALTFHNMGFMTVSAVADKLGIKLNKRECSSLVGVGSYHGDKVILAQPLTYMNLSGQAARELMGRYKIEPTDLIVAFDDIDIPRATVRVRAEGSGGTHNGMRNIIECIGSKNFPRVRVGIGAPPDRMPLADYVLKVIPKAERESLLAAIDTAANEVIKLLDNKQA